MLNTKLLKNIIAKNGLAFCFISGSFFANPVFADFKKIPSIERKTNSQIEITWENKNPVSIYMVATPDGNLKEAKQISKNLKSNSLIVENDIKLRAFYFLKDENDNEIIKTSERLIKLEMGSNFRDIGGYKTINGKIVKWGKIYRTGATAMLNDSDLEIIKSLKVKELIDLRSIEERVLAPTKINQVKYNSYGYSIMSMMPKQSSGTLQNGVDLYRNFPKFFAPQVKIVFDTMLREQNPIVYNCSAGQDRTGFVTAVILASLGVSKETIFEDYHLSTKYRVPVNEFPKINPELHKDNAAAMMFAKYQAMPNYNVPTPLINAEGKSYLIGVFEEIEKQWGSVDNYLIKEIGMTPNDLKKLKTLYLE
ncbi:MAG: tyrosine-protein phosphatase [Caulobacterales bacterium]|nr:tyrosine-protein phosphatase [Caulobacterales bacterium]